MSSAGVQQLDSNQALVRAADQLEAAAAERSAEHSVHSGAPSIVLAGSTAGAGRVSIGVWVQSELRRIGGERSSAAQARELRDLAQSLRRAASDETGSKPGTDPQVLAASILIQKSYAHEKTTPAPAPQETLLHKILRRLGSLVQQLLQSVFGAAVAVPAFGRILVIAFIVVVAAAAAYLIYLLIMSIARRERPTKKTAMGTPLPSIVHPETLYEQALAAAHAGQYAQAIALLFQAALRVFDSVGKVPYDASLTPGEYRRAVRRSVAAAADPFDQIAKTFVLAAFAQRAVTSSDFATADQAYRTMRPLLTA